ncbi:MAG: hypothetical protein PHO72_10805, partial [Sphaerochaeta sp.]|nr:hypothetical protein [Sphaerochaeta sp.]
MIEGKVVRTLPIALYVINQATLPFVDFTLDETYVESVITHSETLRRAQDAIRLFRTIFQILRKLFSKGSAK